MDVLEKTSQYITHQGLISPGDAVIVAVSGGPDSMALLDVLCRLLPQGHFTLAAAHLNHQLRPEAEEEKQFVRQRCRDYNLPCYIRQVDVKKVAREEKKGLEEAARECRYAFFRDLMVRPGAQRVATAHHRNDQAEGVLFNLLRGAGVKGLRGMLPAQGPFIRPFLCLNREEIALYLKERSLPFCIDASNTDIRFTRNRIRHRLLPFLEQEFNPRTVDILNQLSDIARQENDYLEAECARIWSLVLQEEDQNTLCLDAEQLKKLHPALQRRLLLQALELTGGEGGWSLGDVERARALLEKDGSNKQLHPGKGITVRKSYRSLVFQKQVEETRPFSYQVPIPGNIFVSELGETFSFTVQAGPGDMNTPGGELYLDYDRLPPELLLRSRQSGDRLQPRGMSGHKKLKDLFIDMKLTREERERVPVLASPGGEIYALLGLRVAAPAAVQADTGRVLVSKRLPGDQTNSAKTEAARDKKSPD